MRPEKTATAAPANAKSDNLSLVPSAAPAPDRAVAVIDQVRELLFGETKRSTDLDLKALDEKVDSRLAAMGVEMRQRFSELESRLADLQRETEANQAKAVDAIGAAIQQLGASIRNTSGGARSK